MSTEQSAEKAQEFYRVPGVINPRLTVWASDCQTCGKRVRFGPGTKAMCRRMVAAVGGRVLCPEHSLPPG